MNELKRSVVDKAFYIVLVVFFVVWSNWMYNIVQTGTSTGGYERGYKEAQKQHQQMHDYVRPHAKLWCAAWSGEI